jgi:hypothetical protein
MAQGAGGREIDVNDGAPRVTQAGMGAALLPPPIVGRFRLVTIEPRSNTVPWESAGQTCSIGSEEGNDLRVDVATVSRFHCEIRIEPRARASSISRA